MRLNKRNKKIFDMKTKENLSNKQIADEMNISIARVSQILSAEYKLNKYIKPTQKAKNSIQQIINLYNGDVHTKDIAKMFNVSERYIRILLENAGVFQKKKKSNNKTLNYSIINDINSYMQYFYGFCTGSGKYDPDHNVFSIYHTDKNILQKLFNIIFDKSEFNKKNIKQENNSVYKLEINNKIIIKNLMSYGIVHTNNYKESLNVDLIKSIDFWRGYIDSSGNLGFTTDGKKSISMPVKNTYIKEAANIFFNNNIEYNYNSFTNNFEIEITEKNTLIDILEIMYLKDATKLRLARNYERALFMYENL